METPPQKAEIKDFIKKNKKKQKNEQKNKHIQKRLKLKNRTNTKKTNGTQSLDGSFREHVRNPKIATLDLFFWFVRFSFLYVSLNIANYRTVTIHKFNSLTTLYHFHARQLPV